MRAAVHLALCLGWVALRVPAGAQPPTELWLRGYSVIPAPQRVQLTGGDVVVDATWRLDAGKLGPQHVAVRSLLSDLKHFHGLELQAGAAERNVIRLAVAPATVKTGTEAGVERQGYRLRVRAEAVEVTGNADPGVFYGVQTLIQLLKRDGAGRLRLPEGVIEDWPRLELRFLHWDTKHHQDRMETLKRYLDWAARFKVNMIGFELEDKFEYPTHPVIGAPGAFTTAQLQEIVNYGLERFIQVVPQIQAPAHMAYVLKHPEFAELRADGNNYQSNWCDPRTYDLIFSLYDDVIRATQGVEYLFVSTDEVYYAGIDPRCGKPYNEENRSLAWVEFVRRAHEHLKKRGRKMLVWAEYPLLPHHVKLLPPDIIDGVIGEEEYLEWENKSGMRQLGYVSMQGAERLFPDHLSLERAGRVSLGRLESAYEYLARGRYWRGKPIGVFGAAWDDSGLHNETFWLGWSAVAQWGWNPGTASPAQHAAEFMRIYYGPCVEDMVEIYRMMQAQARAWERTWDRVVSRVRGPGYGNSYGKGIGTTRYDLTLTAPGLPRLPDLTVEPVVREKYRAFLEEARQRMLENDRLIHALQTNLGKAERNHYNLEVLLSLARFIGHKWRLLDRMAQAEEALELARESASKNKPAEAVGHLVTAHNLVERVHHQGEQIFAELTAVYEKSRLPKGQSVGGRKFVHILDDTKDHWADRTPDLGFMMAPERSIGLEHWLKDLAQVIHTYAREHNVAVKGLAGERLEE
ncbi:MAG: beta-N-acetylhexosaminidase [Bryobacteraceae bacterium]|jgi:hexosaminidase|nr:beta-N-acetylhexosaminidase [Bryobacteraceae bacterium]